MAQPQIPSVTIELEDNKANVAIDDVTPEFLQLIFDLEITPKILKNSAGLVIPIIKQKLHSNETYRIVTSLEKKEKSETKDKEGNTPLLLASQEANLNTDKFLIETSLKILFRAMMSHKKLQKLHQKIS